MAMLGGLGGGITRDVLLNKIPGALTNPAFITVCLIAGVIGYKVAFAEGQLFREGLFQLATSFSLPWYAIVGAQAAAAARLPALGILALALIATTAGRFYIDVSCGVPPKQFVSGELFVATALVTAAVWIACHAAGLGPWPAAGISFAVGFTLRVAALYPGLAGTAGQGAGRGLPALRRALAARPQDRGQVSPGDEGTGPQSRAHRRGEGIAMVQANATGPGMARTAPGSAGPAGDLAEAAGRF